MYVSQHIILGVVFSVILFLVFPQAGLVGITMVFFSTILIDVDHYIDHVVRKKDWSLKNAYKNSIKKMSKFISLPRKKRDRFYGGFYCLHGLEFLVVLFILSIIVSRYFFFVFLGVSFHLLLDIIHETKYIDRVDKVSIFYDLYKFKKLKFLE